MLYASIGPSWLAEELCFRSVRPFVRLFVRHFFRRLLPNL